MWRIDFSRSWFSVRSKCGCAVVIAGCAWLRLSADVKVGEPFPSLTEARLVGELPATNGQVVLVDFWASWCVPCKASFPVFARFQNDFAARGLAIVAVSVDENVSAYDGFVRKMKPPFAVVRDVSQHLVANVKVPAMPTSYLLGRDGRLRFVHSGFHGEASEREMRREIETLLAEK